jgi:hypothetical protein
VDWGQRSKCPFCAARSPTLRIFTGARLTFLSGLHIGQQGVVQENDPAYGLSHGEFLVEFTTAKGTGISRITRGLELYLPVEMFSVPDWMPSLSMEDAYNLHEVVLSGLDPRGEPPKVTIAQAVTMACWSWRLPLSGQEILPFLTAHGMPSDFDESLVELFDFGRSVAVSVGGRRPNGRKKMPPLSKARYQTKNQAELWYRLFGYA